MFQVISQITLDVKSFALVVATIVAVASVIILIMAFTGGIKRRAISVVLFWTLALSVLAIPPLFTTVTIYSYGFMLAVAVIVSSILLARDAHRSSINADLIFDLMFWVVIGGIIGARLFYIALNYQFFLDHPREMIMVQNGGLAWQGALFLGSLVGMLYIRSKNLPFMLMLDVVVPYLALGQSIGRIGCFFNGCCYGKEWSDGIFFPVHGAHLHPTQLYLAGGYFIIFIMLKIYQRQSQLPGLVFASYLMLASCLRFGVEFFRADHDVLFLGLSVFQFASIGFLMVAFFFVYVIIFVHSRPPSL